MKILVAEIWLIILSGGLCVPGMVLAQNIDSVDSHIRNSLSNHYKRYPQEKLFLHTDASMYANGQTIWYKAYALAYGKPSALSSIAYVVLADSAGNMVIKNKLPMKSGRTKGNIDLPDSLKSGWYQLIGFTTKTKNFGEEGAFHKKIYIQYLNERLVDTHVATENKYHIAFYPEGGDP